MKRQSILVAIVIAAVVGCGSGGAVGPGAGTASRHAGTLHSSQSTNWSLRRATAACRAHSLRVTSTSTSSPPGLRDGGDARLSITVRNDGRRTCSIGGSSRFTASAATNTHVGLRARMSNKVRLVPRQVLTLDLFALWRSAGCRRARVTLVSLRSGKTSTVLRLRHRQYLGVCTPVEEVTLEPDVLTVAYVYFKNDLGRPVFLARCPSSASPDCLRPFYRDYVAAKAVHGVDASPNGGAEWAVESRNGRLLRCVLLRWGNEPLNDLNVRLSRAARWAIPCPRKTTTTIH